MSERAPQNGTDYLRKKVQEEALKAENAKSADIGEVSNIAESSVTQDKAAQAKAYWEMSESISDLVTVDGAGGIHKPAGSGRSSGQYLSRQHAELIAAHQDQIREGIKELNQQKTYGVQSKIDPAHAREVFSGNIIEDFPYVDPEDAYKVFGGGANTITPTIKITDLPNDGWLDSSISCIDPEQARRIFSGHSVSRVDQGDDDPSNKSHSISYIDPEQARRIFSGGEGLSEVYERLDEARSGYAQATAKDRMSYLGRFIKGDGFIPKLLRRIPGVGKSLEAVNKHFDESILAAREQYEEQLDTVLLHVALETKHGANTDPEEIVAAKKAELINEDLKLERQIAAELERRSKGAGRFTSWWMSQNGKKFGRVKKAAVVAGGAFIAAGVVTTFLPGVILGASTGTIVGGLTGGTIAHQVHRRRNRAEVGRRDDGATITWAEKQAELHHANLENYVNDDATEEDINAGSIIDKTEQDTDKEKAAERRRLKLAFSIGAAAGSLAGVTIGGRLHNVLENSGNGNASASQTAPTRASVIDNNSGANTPYTPRPSTKEVAEHILSGHVNAGDGFTQVLHQQFGNLSPEQLYQMHKDAVKTFGDHYITGVDTYTMADGNLGFSGTGNAEFAKGFGEFAQQWIATHS